MKKIITGWLLLEKLPGVKSGTQALKTISQYKWAWVNGDGSHTYPNEYMMEHPNFFLPIYDDEEVCPECKGGVMSEVCSTCRGQRKISKAPVKPPWPPVKGQVVWFLGYKFNICDAICEEYSDGRIMVERKAGVAQSHIYVVDCFATKEQAEKYLALRQEMGLA